MRIMRAFVNGELGTSMSVPGSGSWQAQIVLYDEAGNRIETAGAGATCKAEFYTAPGRQNAKTFEKSVSLHGSINGQAKLQITEDSDFVAGETQYMYIVLDETDDYSVGANYSILNIY